MACENLPQSEGVEYRIIEGYPDYAVGDDGSVWSKRKNGRWNKMNTSSDKDGYLQVRITNGLRTQRRVHHLVLEAFVGPCPNGHQACHFPDRDVTNNRRCNLRWDTLLENARDRIRHGTQVRGESQPRAKLTDADVSAIREEYFSGDVRAEDIAARYDVTATLIQNIVRGKTWKHVSGPISKEVLTRRGDRKSCAKISGDEVLAMRMEFSAGQITVHNLATKYGLSYLGAYDILRGTNWKHIGGPIMEKVRCRSS